LLKDPPRLTEQWVPQTAKRIGGSSLLLKRVDYWLTDLHDLAVRLGQTAGFQTELERIRQVHAAKESFLRRLAKANL
jgi:hypothetical protein